MKLKIGVDSDDFANLREEADYINLVSKVNTIQKNAGYYTEDGKTFVPYHSIKTISVE